MVLMLDTNVILDHAETRIPFYEDSRLVCLLGAIGEVKTCASVSMMTDLFYLMRKSHGSYKAQKMIENDLSFINWVAVTPADASIALKQHWNDFEDCLVCQCAKKVGADYIITRDKNGFKDSPIEAITPSELLQRFKDSGREYGIIEICNCSTS